MNGDLECRMKPAIRAALLPLRHVFATAIDIADATWEQDTQEATDLVLTIKNPGVRILCRARSFHYKDRYPNDVTFRSRNRTPIYATELAKVFGPQRFGDFMFYGFADRRATDLDSWRLIELDVLRQVIGVPVTREGVDRVFQPERLNGDGTGFRVVDVADHPQCIVASHGLPDLSPALTLFDSRLTA